MPLLRIPTVPRPKGAMATEVENELASLECVIGYFEVKPFASIVPHDQGYHILSFFATLPAGDVCHRILVANDLVEQGGVFIPLIKEMKNLFDNQFIL